MMKCETTAFTVREGQSDGCEEKWELTNMRETQKLEISTDIQTLLLTWQMTGKQNQKKCLK